MIKRHDQRCTPLRQNLTDLWRAIRTGGRIGHELENVVREALRRLLRRCPGQISWADHARAFALAREMDVDRLRAEWKEIWERIARKH